MIKTVLFDLGNVLLPFDLMRLANRLTQYSPFNAAEILEKIAYNKVAEDFETGRMSEKSYFEFVSAGCQFTDLSYDEFISIFCDIFTEDKEVTDLISNLKKNYRLGLISNTNPIHVTHLRKSYPSLDHFEHLWFSNEAGVRKPDPAIYEMALIKFSAKPEETVFIDDFEENITGARALGINAIWYKSVDKLKQELRELGVQH